MRLPLRLRDVPGRTAAGAFVLHSGLEKWSADEQIAAGVHGMASGAYPFLKDVPPQQFLKALSVGEIAVGTALVAPIVPTAVAGAVLTGFASALLTMYARTPALRKPGSIWPNPQGIGVSKDVWMLGIGLGFLADAVVQRRRG